MTREERLIQLIALGRALPLEGVYVFGSWLRGQNPRDLDLLLVYDPVKCNNQQITDLRRSLSEASPRLTGLPAHITALTIEEERELSFIRNYSCIGV
jgi:predicted nucleotidyltransferase